MTDKLPAWYEHDEKNLLEATVDLSDMGGGSFHILAPSQHARIRCDKLAKKTFLQKEEDRDVEPMYVEMMRIHRGPDCTPLESRAVPEQFRKIPDRGESDQVWGPFYKNLPSPICDRIIEGVTIFRNGHQLIVRDVKDDEEDKEGN